MLLRAKNCIVRKYFTKEHEVSKKKDAARHPESTLRAKYVRELPKFSARDIISWMCVHSFFYNDFDAVE